MIRHWLFWIVLGYVCGSLPFAWWIAWGKGVNLWQVGSGNIGATNVGRAVGRKWGVACFVLDVFKGLIPVLSAGWVMGCISSPNGAPATDQAWLWMGVAAAAVTGHMYPVWLGFKGGKGVATGLGAMLGLWPVMAMPVAVAAGVWLAVVKVSGYVSLASIAAAVSIPLVVILSGLASPRGGQLLGPFEVVSMLLVVLVVLRHRSNIARLVSGTEHRVGHSPAAGSSTHAVKPGSLRQG